MVKFPDGLGWGKVTGRFVNGLADSFDEGDAPDLEGAKGVEVVFRPSVSAFTFAGADGGSLTVFPGEVRATVDGDGVLRNGSG